MSTENENMKRLKALYKELEGAHQDAFYSGIPNPETPEDLIHNQELCYEIEVIKDKINQLKKEINYEETIT